MKNSHWVVSGLAILINVMMTMTPVWAEIAQTETGTATIEQVKLAKAAKIEVEGSPRTLTQLGAALRRKKIAVFWAKVYVAQFFSASISSLEKSPKLALAQLSAQPLVAISLTLQRNLSSSQLKAGFEDSLKKNSVDPASSGIKPILAAIEKAGEQKENSTIWLVFNRHADGSEIVILEDGKGLVQSIAVEKGVIQSLLSIWFGKPADGGMEEFQEKLFGGK